MSFGYIFEQLIYVFAYFTQISNLGGKNCTHQIQLGSHCHYKGPGPTLKNIDSCKNWNAASKIVQSHFWYRQRAPRR